MHFIKIFKTQRDLVGNYIVKNYIEYLFNHYLIIYLH